MNPLESRSGSNTGRVRMFGKDALSQNVLTEKWDRIKVVCTQPFNKTVQYGVSFIKVHGPAKTEDDSKPMTDKRLGVFKLKGGESPDRFEAGSLFAKHKDQDQKEISTPLKGAAAMRAASKLADEILGVSPKVIKQQPSQSRPVPMATKLPHTPSQSNKTSSKTETVSFTVKKPTPKLADTPSQKPSHSNGASSSSYRDTSPPPKKFKATQPKKAKDFNQLLKRVVFCLSGYKNPERGEIRDKGLAMGAKYRSDWTNDCTHLICAFTNTPKYQTVSGKGKIVSHKWIMKCYDRKEKLPWRKYRMGDARTPPVTSSESEDNDGQDEAPPLTPPTSTTEVRDILHVVHDDNTESLPKKTTEQDEIDSDEAYNMSTDEDSPDTDDEAYNMSTDEDSPDTDDEINAIRREKERKSNQDKKTQTTKNQQKLTMDGLPILPDFFEGKTFFLLEDLNAQEKRDLFRVIIAFGGEVEEDITLVNYAITRQDWTDKFDTALSNNPQIVFLKPQWVMACHDQNKAIPYQPYVVSKK